MVWAQQKLSQGNKKSDFSGLVKKWNQPIKEFYFIVNDKYKGVNIISFEQWKEMQKHDPLQKDKKFITESSLMGSITRVER